MVPFVERNWTPHAISLPLAGLSNVSADVSASGPGNRAERFTGAFVVHPHIRSWVMRLGR